MTKSKIFTGRKFFLWRFFFTISHIFAKIFAFWFCDSCYIAYHLIDSWRTQFPRKYSTFLWTRNRQHRSSTLSDSIALQRRLVFRVGYPRWTRFWKPIRTQTLPKSLMPINEVHTRNPLVIIFDRRRSFWSMKRFVESLPCMANLSWLTFFRLNNRNKQSTSIIPKASSCWRLPASKMQKCLMHNLVLSKTPCLCLRLRLLRYYVHCLIPLPMTHLWWWKGLMIFPFHRRMKTMKTKTKETLTLMILVLVTMILTSLISAILTSPVLVILMSLLSVTLKWPISVTLKWPISVTLRLTSISWRSRLRRQTLAFWKTPEFRMSTKYPWCPMTIGLQRWQSSNATDRKSPSRSNRSSE